MTARRCDIPFPENDKLETFPCHTSSSLFKYNPSASDILCHSSSYYYFQALMVIISHVTCNVLSKQSWRILHSKTHFNVIGKYDQVHKRAEKLYCHR